MTQRNLVSGSCILALLFLISCGTSVNPPPPKWTAENPNASNGAKPGAPQGAAAKPAPVSGGSSSLDALRSGQSTATSPSSPLQDSFFAFDRYDLEESARATLKANAEWMKANPSTKVQIEGHCDERGTNEYNMALGAKRAQAARDYLVTLGIGADRLSTISYGEEVPVCKESNETCWAKNRRARSVILGGKPTS
jgi:peptidoglycan-associated lipoprotein